MKAITHTLIMFSVLLASCSEKTPDVEELSQRFLQYQTQFNQLADLSCSLKKSLNAKFHHHKINNALDYPDPIAAEFLKLNTLLKQIEAEGITFSQEGASECSLFITQWSVWFHGEGSYMGYSYHPPKLNEYNPAIHQKDKRNTKENLHFTKALADGWYVEYVNTP